MIGKGVSDIKMLMKHVDGAAVLAYAWEHDVRKWTVEKENDMCSKIDYNFIFPAKRGKKRSYETTTCKY